VDASSASAFRERWRRVLVSGAGIMVELALAAAAALLWTQAEPGAARALLFNIVLIAGTSTLLFNGNPLLRFDGYYILMDLIGVPNLDTRARRYWVYLLQRHGFGAHRTESPAEAPRERAWLLGYGAAAFVYRVAVMLTVALLVATQVVVVGVLLALWSIGQMLIWPLLKGLRFLVTAPALRDHRGRAVLVTAAGTGLVLGALLVVPVPYATLAQGAVVAPEDAALRTGADGFVTAILAQPGQTVRRGDPLVALEDPVAAARVEVYRAQLAVLETRFAAVNVIDRQQMRLAQEQLAQARQMLARAEERQAALLVRAERDGTFVPFQPERLPGRFLRQGELIGHVLAEADPGIRVVVPQSEIDLVRSRTRAVAIRLVPSIAEKLPARIVRETPQALLRVPAPSLGAEGGGPILTIPGLSPGSQRPIEQFFEIELATTGAAPQAWIGGRVHVRFQHDAEPIGWRLLRSARQLFLSVLHV
jgi:putative peptide zinc metalloprotease protein